MKNMRKSRALDILTEKIRTVALKKMNPPVTQIIASHLLFCSDGPKNLQPIKGQDSCRKKSTHPRRKKIHSPDRIDYP
jgi:hypothetical protein